MFKHWKSTIESNLLSLCYDIDVLDNVETTQAIVITGIIIVPERSIVTTAVHPLSIASTTVTPKHR